ncbi:hypothetical protein D3C86_1677290 [compost metagenome]
MAQKEGAGRVCPVAGGDEWLDLIAQIRLISARLTMDCIGGCGAWAIWRRRVVALPADPAVFALCVRQADKDEFLNLGALNVQATA